MKEQPNRANVNAWIEELPGPLTPEQLLGWDDVSWLEYAKTEFVLIIKKLPPAEYPEVFTTPRGFEFTVESLLHLSSTKVLEKSLYTAIPLLDTIIRANMIETILDASRKMALSVKHQAERETYQSTFIQTLIGLPSRVSNVSKGKEHLELANPVIKSLIHCVFFISQAPPATFETAFIAKLLSKLLIHFKDAPWQDFVEILFSLAHHNEIKLIIQDIFNQLTGGGIETLAVKMLHYDVSFFLLKTDTWRHVLTKIAFDTQDDVIIYNLIKYLRSQDLLSSLTSQLMLEWCSKSSILSGATQEHLCLSKFLVLAVQSSDFDRKQKIQLKNEIFDAIKTHLDSTDPEVRAIGMICAEIIFEIMDKEVEEKLRFDYDENVGKVVASVRNILTFEPPPVEVLSLEEIDCKLRTSVSSKPPTSKEIKVTDPPQVTEVILKKTHLVKAPKVLEELDSDDDEDLQPYDMSNDTPKVTVQKPKFLVDLRDGLLSNDEPDLFQISLEACSELLVKLLPGQTPEVGLDFLRILVMLQEKSHVPDFERHTFESCVKITEIFPKESALYLAQEFHTEATRHSISRRAFMLDVLGEAAKRLSGAGSTTVAAEASSVAPVKYKLFKESEDVSRQKQNQETIRQRLESKTRKIATKTTEPQGQENKFTAVAGYFFFPLAHGFGKNQFTLASRQALLKNDHENHLLLSFLHTLAVVMISATNSPQGQKFAAEAFELSQVLRFSEHAKVRLAVLHLLSAVFMSVPPRLLYLHFYADLMELKTWLEEILAPSLLRREKSEECLRVADNLMKICYNVLIGE